MSGIEWDRLSAAVSEVKYPCAGCGAQVYTAIQANGGPFGVSIQICEQCLLKVTDQMASLKLKLDWIQN